jgi:hypothetical protein
MLVRLIQATTITLGLYGLLGLNALQTTTVSSQVQAAENPAQATTVEPTEALVALKEAFIRRP